MQPELESAARKWSRLFLITALPASFAFAVLTPPFQIPDEIAHFERAYEVSEAGIVSKPQGVGAGAVLPDSIPRMAERLAGDVPFHPERKVSSAAVVEAFHVPLDPGNRSFVEFSNSALTSFVPYLPQASGIALARLFTNSVLALFYCGRVGNLVASVVLSALAIRRTPFARPLFFLLASTPMVIFERASLSSDATTDALALYAVALFLQIAFGGRGVSAGTVAHVLCVVALLGLSKSAYVFLALLVLLVPTAAVGSRGRRAVFVGLALGAGVAAAAGWSLLFKRAFPGFRLYPGTDPARQLAGMIDHPFAFLATAVSFFAKGTPRLAVQFVGRLGWLDTPLPLPVVLLAGLLIVLVAATAPDVAKYLRAGQRTVLGVTVALSLFWMSVLLYLVVSPVGSSEIGGVQGRHLIPLAAPFFLSWSGAARPIDWNRRAAPLALAVTATCAVALWAVVRRYYV